MKAKSGLVTLSKYKMYILYKGARNSFADLLSLKKEERKKMEKKKQTPQLILFSAEVSKHEIRSDPVR